MHPVAYRRLARDALALGNLVLMVREAQIDSASVDIELLAEVFGRHGGALDMPAGEADTPRAGPVHLAFLISVFPEREIFGGVFVFGNLHLLATMTTLAQLLNCI